MNVLSLFDGMSCGQIALERAGIHVDNYFASETDKYAVNVTQKNYPRTVQLGDVRGVKAVDLPPIDLLIGGSPCQGFSGAGHGKGFDDSRSALFFEYVRVLRDVKPLHFLLENVRMNKAFRQVFTRELGVGYVEIDSSLVSAQCRKRLYWTNLTVTQPADLERKLGDVIVSGFVDRDKSYVIDANYAKGMPLDEYISRCRRQLVSETEIYVYEKPHGFNRGRVRLRDKFSCLREATSRNYAVCDTTSWRKLLPVECERLQTVPDGYTDGVSNAQRYKMLGNGWTVDVIAHILKGISTQSGDTKC